MLTAKVLRAKDYPRRPWKNGGGFTEEVARDAGNALDEFGWRLSIADIEASSDFSCFAGYQRIITVLQGDGMRLSIDGKPSRPLVPFDAFAFDGKSQVNCTLLGGPIRDFNLIYAPNRYRARLQWLEGGSRLFTDASVILVFSGQQQLQVSVDAQAEHALEFYDCLYLSGNDHLMELELTGRCCLIELTAVTSS